MKRLLLCAVALILLTTAAFAQTSKNPAARDFDAAGSDARAVGIADEVMNAMGGRKAWDKTDIIAWNFLGIRKLVWNKRKGDVRVDNLRNDQTVLLNINTEKGRVFRNGKEETNPDSVAAFVKQGKANWINDSYWLLMPFKLKDSGVTLKFIGEENMENGKPADVLQMTFKGVGVTPDNKYKIWIDKTSRLVSQWSYYPKFSDEKPGFTLPWTDYKKHGQIIIAGERGPRHLTDIMVFSSLPGDVFSDFKRPDMNAYPVEK